MLHYVCIHIKPRVSLRRLPPALWQLHHTVVGQVYLCCLAQGQCISLVVLSLASASVIADFMRQYTFFLNLFRLLIRKR